MVTVYYSLHLNINEKFEAFQYLATWIVIYRQSVFKESRFLFPNINLKHNTNNLTKDMLIIIFLPKILKNNALDKTLARVWNSSRLNGSSYKIPTWSNGLSLNLFISVKSWSKIYPQLWSNAKYLFLWYESPLKTLEKEGEKGKWKGR